MSSEPSQTETWAAQAQRGDRLALAKLLTTCHARLRARAQSRMEATLRARIGPEDILQEVYLDLVRQIDGFENRGPGSFLNWAYAILEHKLVDARRALHCKIRDVDREVGPGRRATDSYWDLLDNVYTRSGSPSGVVRRQEALGALLASLSDLSETHRQVLQMRFLEGLSVGEVATRLGRSEDAVVSLTRRALRALRKAMDRLGEFTHGP